MSLQGQRKKKGYSARELGKVTGISYRTIQAMELGDKDINLHNLRGLCTFAKVLDCTLFDILTDEELKIKLKLVLNNSQEN